MTDEEHREQARLRGPSLSLLPAEVREALNVGREKLGWPLIPDPYTVEYDQLCGELGEAVKDEHLRHRRPGYPLIP